MVDWIETFAWPFVEDIRKVTLEGVIKKDPKPSSLFMSQALSGYA
ncbi:hypothetical protein SNOG_06225 [Parastagonospora nodorum SN15]|uniref:Uncharacterized protein n=1 Tax=Phaeosphaeria nodorum (strain SN15 / ATCC MYA-4574 / FGSC 10173) TaxID=321614 RepID=Q0UPT9_PHANO|nr:hypothetical protein SNOG_06225 [Parastagonospora nodorum SN15]EAT86056.1 hypothetical protein SNOG_06225 [Parastagonospora nodorum SN15]